MATELKLGPVVYKLVFDNPAVLSFEDEYRRRFGRERAILHFLAECVFYFQDAMATQQGEVRQQIRGPSFTELSVAIWALANTNHVKTRGRDAVTVEKIQREMSPANYVDYLGVIVQVMGGASPKTQNEEVREADQGTVPSTA